jgi:hypothetical protein
MEFNIKRELYMLAKTDQKKVSKKSSKSNMSILTMDAQKASKACEQCTLEKTKAPGVFLCFFLGFVFWLSRYNCYF